MEATIKSIINDLQRSGCVESANTIQLLFTQFKWTRAENKRLQLLNERLYGILKVTTDDIDTVILQTSSEDAQNVVTVDVNTMSNNAYFLFFKAIKQYAEEQKIDLTDATIKNWSLSFTIETGNKNHDD